MRKNKHPNIGDIVTIIDGTRPFKATFEQDACFKVGDRVRVNDLGSGYENVDGVIQPVYWVLVGKQTSFVTFAEKYLELIPPTTEQLVEMLEKAGWITIYNGWHQWSGWEFRHFDNTLITTCGDEEFLLPCKDFASAVKLALTLVEVVK